MGTRTTFAMVILLALVAVGGCGDKQDTPAAPPESRAAAATGPTPSTTVTLGKSPAVSRVRVDRLPQGPPPAIEYVYGTDVVLPDGTTVPLAPPAGLTPEEEASRSEEQFATSTEGWLTNTGAGDLPVLMAHRRDGSLLHTNLGHYLTPVATSSDGRRALADGPVVYGPGATITTWAAPANDGLAAGFLGADDIVFNLGDRVLLGHPDGRRTRLPGLTQATATAQDRGWVIATPIAADGTHGVFDADTGEQILASSDFELLGFSPDHRHVVARGQDGLMVAELRTGRIRLTLSRLDVTSTEPGTFAWEDSDHLLAVVNRPRDVRYLVRTDLAGNLELAAGPSNGDHYDNYVLPAPRG